MYDPDRCEIEKSTEEDEELEIVEEAWRKPTNVQIEPEWQKNLNEAGEDVQIVESDYIDTRSPSPTEEPDFDFDLLKRMVEYKWPSLQDQYHSPDIENEVYTTKHLGYGIRMVMPLHLYEGEIYIAEPLDPDRRTKEFEFIKLAEDETCCTDIYILVKKSLDGKKSPINFHSDYSDDIKFLMSIKETPRGPTEFIAHILANGQWSLVETSYEENEIKFCAATVELLFVITRPKTQHFELTPDGFLFQDENDSTLQVDFPEGSVDQNYSIGIKILHPDTESMKLRHQMFPNLHNIVAITQKIQVNHKVEKFLSPIEIRSALEKFLPDMSHEYHMVRIWWHGNDVTITDANNVECKDDVVTAGVKEFSG